MEPCKNSISYSEIDLDFIGGLNSISELGSVKCCKFDFKWIDSMLSPFLISRDQVVSNDSITVIQCYFHGTSRLAILSSLYADV